MEDVSANTKKEANSQVTKQGEKPCQF